MSHCLATAHFIHQLMGILVGCTFWLVPILLYEDLCKVFCMYTFSFLLDVYTPGVELLGQMVTPYLNFLNYQTLFQCATTILHSHRQCIRSLISTHPHQQSTCYYMIFDCNLHLCGCEVVSPYDFGLLFPDDWWF